MTSAAPGKLWFTNPTVLIWYLGSGAAMASVAVAPVPDLAAVQHSLRTLSVPFIENAGQLDSRIRFSAAALAGTLFVTAEGDLVYALPASTVAAAGVDAGPAGRTGRLTRVSGEPTPGRTANSFSEHFVGAHPLPQAGTPHVTTVSSFVGADPGQHRTGIRTYESVSLGEVFPGIDVRLRATGQNVEKIFTVRPNADPARIVLQVDGVERIAAAGDGSLVVTTSDGDVTFTPPVAYQTIRGHQVPVQVAYALDSRAKRYGFTLGSYDPGEPLVIDPLYQSTYLGGTNSFTEIYAVTVHPVSGDIIVVGGTGSTNFPQTGGSTQIGNAGGTDGFVARLNPGLTAVLQATYYGSPQDEVIFAVAVNPLNGEIIVLGNSNNALPGMTGGFQSSPGVSNSGFLARFSANAASLLQGTYLGASDYTHADVLTVHPVSGDIYVGGHTWAKDFPGTSGGAQPAHSPFGRDAFVARLNSQLTGLIGATYYGGTDADFVYAMTIHPATGDIYIAGETSSLDLPGTAGGAQPAFNYKPLETDAYIAHFDPALSVLWQATYLGGRLTEQINSISINPQNGEVLVGGATDSNDFPGTAGGAQELLIGNGGYSGGFAARLNGSLTALLQSTYVTGNNSTSVTTVFAHPATGEIYVAGATSASDILATGGGTQPALAGGYDMFISRLDSRLSTVLQSTYLGASGDDTGAVQFNPVSGEILYGGSTISLAFPGTAGGAQPGSPTGGASDAGAIARMGASLRTEWTDAAGIGVARSDHVLTVLQNGLVLASGGWNGSDSIAVCELYNPRTNGWTAAGSLAAARSDHTATTLPTGKVLIVGGYGLGGVALAANELYNPATNQHGPAAALTTGRYYHTTTLLPNGKVLVVGGANGGALASAELYDPVGNSWASAGALTSARYLHTATLLPNGKVLIAGGRNGGALISAELYNPATNSWSSAGNMGVARDSHSATLLASGNVLIAGGFNGGALASAETYNAAINSWGGPTTMKTARFSHSATLLPNGRVLVSGGYNNGGVQRAAETFDGSNNTWTAASPMNTARDFHAAVLLPGGKVFVAGGLDSGGGTAEFYEFAAAKSTPAPSLGVARSDHSATLLPNGKVLVAGGYGAAGVAIAGSELYSAATNSWAATSPLSTARFYHSATLLPNGKVLVAGGAGVGAGNFPVAAELYDPATNTWSSAGSMAAGRYLHTATLLADGKVLIAGGKNASNLASAELYNPTTNSWSGAGTMPAARYWHTATLLPSNKVLIAGGIGGSVLATGTLYDPSTNSWGGAASLTSARYGHTATSLPSGKVLVAGGSAANTLRSAELYDPAGNSWSPAGSLVAARDLHSAALLPNGKVLVAGGYTGGAGTAEFYDPQSGSWSGAMQIGTPRSDLAATLLLNNKVLLSGGYAAGAAVAVANLLDVGLVQNAALAPVLNTATSPLLPGTTPLVAFGFNFHPAYEASGAAVGSSPTNTPLVQIMRVDDGHTLWLPVDVAHPWSDSTYTTTAAALAGWPLGYVQVRTFVSGQPSAALMVRTVVRGLLDIDENLAYDALTDGLMVIRYLFGLSGTFVTAGAVGTGALTTDPAALNSYLLGIRSQLDVDGNGQSDALTDGLLILRYMFGLRGASLIQNAISPGASRNTAPAVESYIQSLMP